MQPCSEEGPVNTLLVFARFPRLGRVKSRLAGTVGEQFAFDLYCAMLQDTLERYRRMADRRFLYLAECDCEEGLTLVRGWGMGTEYEVALQAEGDLGERMWNAVSEVREVSGKVVIVGSDSPTVPLGYVQQAFDRLGDTPFVIGPVADGGYYLIGLSEFHKTPFEGVDWGSERVLDQTLARVGKENICLLPPWYDVDREPDLDQLVSELAESPGAFPQWTRRVLLRRGHSGQSSAGG